MVTTRRKKPQIEAERYESQRPPSVAYDIYFPGSKQWVAVIGKGLSHWDVKKFLFEATKASLALLGLDGKTVRVGDRVFAVSAGRYEPVEGECRKPECPNFYVFASVRGSLCGQYVEVLFQRNQTSTKAVALAVALSKRADEHRPDLHELLARLDDKYAKSRAQFRRKYGKLLWGEV